VEGLGAARAAGGAAAAAGRPTSSRISRASASIFISPGSTAPPGVFQPPRSHTDRIFSSSGEKTTPVAPSMDVAYAGVIPAWSQTYTSSVLSGTAWWKAKPCAASHSTSTAAPRCKHDTEIATKTAALPVGVPPLPLPTSRCSSSARETTARSAAAGTEPLTRTQQLLNGPRCTDSPARSASTAPVAVAPAASSAAVGRGGAISFELACSHSFQAEEVNAAAASSEVVVEVEPSSTRPMCACTSASGVSDCARMASRSAAVMTGSTDSWNARIFSMGSLRR